MTFTSINQTLYDKDHFLITLQNNIETIICHENSHNLTTIDKRLTELQAELLEFASPDYEKASDEVYHLHEEKQKPNGRDELK